VLFSAAAAAKQILSFGTGLIDLINMANGTAFFKFQP
jgi:hypothetical protein